MSLPSLDGTLLAGPLPKNFDISSLQNFKFSHQFLIKFFKIYSIKLLKFIQLYFQILELIKISMAVKLAASFISVLANLVRLNCALWLLKCRLRWWNFKTSIVVRCLIVIATIILSLAIALSNF